MKCLNRHCHKGEKERRQKFPLKNILNVSAGHQVTRFKNGAKLRNRTHAPNFEKLNWYSYCQEIIKTRTNFCPLQPFQFALSAPEKIPLQCFYFEKILRRFKKILRLTYRRIRE